MRKSFAPLFFIVVLCIGGCIENSNIAKNTSEMSLDENDLPPEWNLTDYSYNKGEKYTITIFKNILNNETILSRVVNWGPSGVSEFKLKKEKNNLQETVRSGAGYEIRTEDFGENTECFAYTILPVDYIDRKPFYHIKCFTKNIEFEIGLLSKNPTIKKENENLILDLAKKIENKIIS